MFRVAATINGYCFALTSGIKIWFAATQQSSIESAVTQAYNFLYSAGFILEEENAEMGISITRTRKIFSDGIYNGKDIQHVQTLPSGGDSSYACWLDTGSGRALISYYSSHEHQMDLPFADDDRFSSDPAYAEHSTASDIFLADFS